MLVVFVYKRIHHWQTARKPSREPESPGHNKPISLICLEELATMSDAQLTDSTTPSKQQEDDTGEQGMKAGAAVGAAGGASIGATVAGVASGGIAAPAGALVGGLVGAAVGGITGAERSEAGRVEVVQAKNAVKEISDEKTMPHVEPGFRNE